MSELGLQAGDRVPAGVAKKATAADVLEYSGDIVNGRWQGTAEVFLTRASFEPPFCVSTGSLCAAPPAFMSARRACHLAALFLVTMPIAC